MPTVAPMPTLPTINTELRGRYGTRYHSTTPVSGAFSTSNSMVAYPFVVEQTTTLYKAFWLNGSAAGSNTEVAVYDHRFRQIQTTGSTAGSGNNAPQVVDWTDIKIGPGLYYAVLAHNSTTANRLWTCGAVGTGAGIGCWQQTSITLGSLPATATPAILTGRMVMFGFITRSSFDI